MDYMQHALMLAGLAQGHTSPNPAVGAVVVNDGTVVGEGFTLPPGSDHAEVVALRRAGWKARGATMYVSLEPCCHYGRTPPCTQAIINAGIAEVHFAMIDPNPLVCGRGISEMETAGIKTVLEECDQAEEVNEAYVKYITRGLPFVTAKFAMSLDGKVATKSGDSKWISGEESRRYVHCLRYVVDAIMVGVDTVIADDPRLTARVGKEGGRIEKQPLRVIVDSRARTPVDAQVFQMPGKTLIAVTEDVDPTRARALSEAGADILYIPSKDGRVDLEELLLALGRMEVTNILVEGGATLFGSLFDQGLVDKLLTFVAPIIIGGEGAKSPVEGRGVGEISKAITLSRIAMERFGDDMLIKGYLKEN